MNLRRSYRLIVIIELSYLRVSTTDPESAVLVGFESKLNVLGLCECGEAVVELGYHILDSLPWLGMEPGGKEKKKMISI